MFLKDEIRRKDKVINTLLDYFSDRVPDYSNYLTSKNTKVRTHTDQQTIKIIQTSTASSIHRENENDKNHKKLNISQLNSKTCDKTHVNKNSNNNTKKESLRIKLIKNLKVKKLLSKALPTP